MDCMRQTASATMDRPAGVEGIATLAYSQLLLEVQSKAAVRDVMPAARTVRRRGMVSVVCCAVHVACEDFVCWLPTLSHAATTSSQLCAQSTGVCCLPSLANSP